MKASSTNDSSLLETIWKLLETGNKLYERLDYWKAAECFYDAQEKLRDLHEQAKCKVATDDEATTKIAQLYQKQAIEYFGKARKSVICALEKQMKQEDVEKSVDGCSAPIFDADEIGRSRLLLFAQLFAGKDLLNEFKATQEYGKQSDTVSEFSLDERLAQLNQNMPRNLLTTEQRMQHLNKGLNKLGYSLYDSNNAASDKIELPKSEEDEVSAIIAQAKEEVALLRTTNNVASTMIDPISAPTAAPIIGKERHGSFLDQDSDEDDDNSSASSEEARELTPQQIESIRDKIASASAQLSQLLVLLQPDEGGYTDIDFDPTSGKHALQQARRLLSDAAKEWGYLTRDLTT
ncbi:hypothetical protein MPSEU_000932300 [Mayamaea pseudoterrestris]|nr:hypothetical protein MPSEU_000932300 [Mayamaea pseudoterrestris]